MTTSVVKRAADGERTDAPTYTHDELRYELAKRSFVDWLEHVWITEPRPDGTNSRIKFQKWEHLLDAAGHLARERCIIVPKPRQIGWSWLVAAWVLWKTAYNRNFKAMLFSQGQDEAYDLLGKCEYIRTNLPAALMPHRTNDARNALEFGKEWWIRALPSTAKAGHGTTAGIVVFDEADYHEYLDASYAAVKPTIDDIGGQIILISKCNPTTPQSLFKKIARGGSESGFKCLFYPWNVRTNRTPEWFEAVRRTYADPFEFAKAYPATLEEALEAPREMQVIGKELIEAYRLEARKPVRESGIIKVWQHFVPGRRYIAASDVSHGVGLDRSVTVIVDVQAGAVVADIVTRTTEVLQFAIESISLLNDYGSPVWAIEDNDWGRRVIDRAQALNYPRVYFRDANNAGWRTHDYTRPILWGNILDALFHRTLVIPNIDAIEEMMGLIRNPDRRGRVEASAGATDDYMVALGIALSCRDSAAASEYAEPGANNWHPKRSFYKWSGRRNI